MSVYVHASLPGVMFFIRPCQPISARMASLAGAHDIEPTTVSRTALQGPAADAVSRAGLGGQPAYSCTTAAGDISRRSAGSEPASSSQAAHRGAPQNDLRLVCNLHCEHVRSLSMPWQI